MLQPSTVRFLQELGKNNNKPWFDQHRDEYQAAKEDFEGLVDSILETLVPIAPALAGLKAKECTFRIFRDVRFSKDKTPYKAHFGAFMGEGGRKCTGAGYYLHVEPGKSFAGGGLWMPEGPRLKAVRQEIDYNFEEFSKMVSSREFKKYFKQIDGESLKTLPQGYSADNPAIAYLKMKSFTAGTPLADKDLTAKGLVSKCERIFTALSPLVDFLDRSAD
ncbi:MAG: DUF2461 domain-containing protein [Flavipsychrobacter sp.]|nr:DUF2461 domain-containing protein [Flavipsychrobacter sp.]